jgi:hypothetical protein
VNTQFHWAIMLPSAPEEKQAIIDYMNSTPKSASWPSLMR